jgi:UDP-N-acetylglucosamine--N-acetylmuramyl-(pentapeptide) pyrophosphoryl-undecaprenol N-acetylglucosamine transferase
LQTPKFIISGGGTGGHIFPAIAIANELKVRFKDAEILFVGAKDKMEMEKVPAAGYKIVGLPISGIKRSLSLSNLAVPFKLFRSLLMSARIIKSFKPNVVIGVGGYASAAILRVAVKKNIPSVIQEQNSYPGVTNKILAKSVQKICVAYPGMEKFFPASKIVYTGNPVRKEIIEADTKRAEGRNNFGISENEQVVLVVGGSLGARSINIGITNMLEKFADANIKLIWQTGKLYYEEARKVASSNKNILVYEFIKEMDLAYAAADIIVSRAGALAISELSIIAKPCILVPFPFAAEDHQTHNAKSLSSRDAAILIADADVNEKMSHTLMDLVNDKEKQAVLRKNISGLGKPDATKEIVNEIEKLIA